MHGTPRSSSGRVYEPDPQSHNEQILAGSGARAEQGCRRANPPCQTSLNSETNNVSGSQTVSDELAVERGGGPVNEDSAVPQPPPNTMSASKGYVTPLADSLVGDRKRAGTEERAVCSVCCDLIAPNRQHTEVLLNAKYLSVYPDR